MYCTSTQHVVACKKERTAWRQNLGRQKGGATRAGVGDTAAVPQADVTAHINDTAGLLASAEKTAGKTNASSQNGWKKKKYHMCLVQHELDKLESLYFLCTPLEDGSVWLCAVGSLRRAIGQCGYGQVRSSACSAGQRLCGGSSGGGAVRQQRVPALPRAATTTTGAAFPGSAPSLSTRVIVTCSPSPRRALPGVTGTGGLRTSWRTAGKAPLSRLPAVGLRVF